MAVIVAGKGLFCCESVPCRKVVERFFVRLSLAYPKHNHYICRNNKYIRLMNKNITIEKKDGYIHVKMSPRKWREYEKAIAAYNLARKLKRADKQCDEAPALSVKEALDIIHEL